MPAANARISYDKPPAPYRDYIDIKDREKLLLRILDRLDERMSNTNTDQQQKSDVYYYNFIESWFQKKNEDKQYELFAEQFDGVDMGLFPPKLHVAWSSLGGGTSIDEETNKSSTESLIVLDSEDEVPNNTKMQQNECSNNDTGERVTKYNEKSTKSNNDRILKGNMDEFLSWAFFGVPFSTVQSLPDMQHALDNFYNILATRTGLTFEDGSNPYYKPRSFTFEKVKSLYRPYGVYAGVALMRITANIILYVMGFRHHTCHRGLRYWHRPAKQHEGSPFLFFHGIAPGGHAPYLPMLFLGVLKDELSHRHRDIFLFENKPISYALCFDSLSEDDTVHGVLESIDRHLGTSSNGKNLTLFGHSFGSCQLTWMIKSPEIKNRIGSVYLCDPVSILLSEPDVVVNFLYTRRDIKDSYDGNPKSWMGKLIRFVNETKIHLVASSEMFIETYLRRSFAWYNAELWLQDIPRDVKVVVALAECDEIVNTPKIERELHSHTSKRSKEDGSTGASVEQIIWKDVGHAHCITNPERWSDIHDIMKRVESQVQEEKLRQKSK